jgi:hypothetical protein
MPTSSLPSAIAAQAELHHQLLLGLQLMVATREGPQASGDWMFRLFRRQHEEKFLSSFGKLGLDGLPHAVACARYHVLSNAIGGVAVEYMEESDTKAWVRFRYPRWMVDGAALCGVPLETSRGFLRGWYAHNGVSLRNPRLGFVCVSEDVGEDMSGQYGLCGYFKEYPHELAEAQRLVFAPHERPPPYDPARQPQPPAEAWDAERLAKAQRNYALDYIRNGLPTLVQTLGRPRALELATLAARLTGLQQYSHLAAAVGAVDGGPRDAAAFLAAMFAGMGDECRAEDSADGMYLHHRGLRLLRGLGEEDRADLLACWAALWRGTVHSHRAFMDLKVRASGDGLCWIIEEGRDDDGVDA